MKWLNQTGHPMANRSCSDVKQTCRHEEPTFAVHRECTPDRLTVVMGSIDGVGVESPGKCLNMWVDLRGILLDS